ncbi:hypothetical protein B7494_g2451 [Chlorociboria aeruginascens]|nr:hypothetical protein B7494_g2451 [Chlorociboria aeruginascens]
MEHNARANTARAQATAAEGERGRSTGGAPGQVQIATATGTQPQLQSPTAAFLPPSPAQHRQYSAAGDEKLGEELEKGNVVRKGLWLPVLLLDRPQEMEKGKENRVEEDTSTLTLYRQLSTILTPISDLTTYYLCGIVSGKVGNWELVSLCPVPELLAIAAGKGWRIPVQPLSEHDDVASSNPNITPTYTQRSPSISLLTTKPPFSLVAIHLPDHGKARRAAESRYPVPRTGAQSTGCVFAVHGFGSGSRCGYIYGLIGHRLDLEVAFENKNLGFEGLYSLVLILCAKMPRSNPKVPHFLPPSPPHPRSLSCSSSSSGGGGVLTPQSSSASEIEALQDLFSGLKIHNTEAVEVQKPKPRKVKKKNVAGAFDDYFGDVSMLGNWQKLCADVGIQEMPGSITKCRKVLSKTWVNIYDFLDAKAAGTEVKHWKSEKALAQYTLQSGRIFPKKKAKEGGPARNIIECESKKYPIMQRSIDSSSEHPDDLVYGMSALQLSQRGGTRANESKASTNKKNGGHGKKKTKNDVARAFNSYFGDQSELVNWQRLCEDVRIEEIPPSITKCRTALKKVWVNIHDLLAAKENGTEVRRFKSCRRNCKAEDEAVNHAKTNPAEKLATVKKFIKSSIFTTAAIMPRQRSKKISEGRKAAPKLQNESESSGNENESVEILAKDDDEDELEKLVLGDENGFKAHLGEEMDLVGNEELDEGDRVAEGDLEAQLFFLDSAPSAVDVNLLMPRAPSEDGGEMPAWEDSDDDRLAVSLAGNTRLRKLRVNPEEDIVSGREYTRRLRRQFEVLHPVPYWALPSNRPTKRQRRSSVASNSSISSNEMDIDSPDLSTLPLARLLQDAGSLSKILPTTQHTKLRPEVIDIQRTRDIPLTQPSAISSLSFHPSYPVILSSGLASTLYLHHVAPTAQPTPNPLLTSVHIKHTPLHTSAFLSPSGDKIFFSGRRRYFHIWDLPSGNIQKVTRIYGHKDEQKSMERFKLSPCGRYMGLVGSSKKGGGTINVLDANTSQWIAAARIEGKNGVADFAWWSDGEGFTIVGKGGEVGEWSVESRSFIARWVDDGSIGATVLTLGGLNGPKPLGGDRWVVIGSQSGVVNIYDRRAFLSSSQIEIPERPEPNKQFMQLTTPTSNLNISPDGQLLVISSKWKKDALRLVHLPSCTVYRNWPTSVTPLGRVTATAFSSASDMLAVANEAGKIRLWEIRA